MAKIENSKQSGLSVEVKFIFSDNHPQNMLRPIYKIK